MANFQFCLQTLVNNYGGKNIASGTYYPQSNELSPHKQYSARFPQHMNMTRGAKMHAPQPGGMLFRRTDNLNFKPAPIKSIAKQQKQIMGVSNYQSVNQN